MIALNHGKCGLCSHFGEEKGASDQVLVSIHTSKAAPPELLDSCGHPKHSGLRLKVTPMSRCDGFTPASQA